MTDDQPADDADADADADPDADTDAAQAAPRSPDDQADDTPSPEDAADAPSDVKTGPDGTPIRREASPEQWEAVGRDALATLLTDNKADLVHEVEEVVGAIQYGEPVTAEHLNRLRDAIALLERVVETRLVPLVDAAEPWELTPRRVPAERLRETLDRDDDGAGSDSGESRPE